MEMVSTRRSFDLNFKLKVIKYAKEKSVAAAAKKFGLDRKCVRPWKQHEPEIGMRIKIYLKD